MTPSRREIIRSASLAPIVALAGCGVLSDDGEGTEGQQTTEQGGTETETATRTETQTETATEQPVQQPELARRTGRILSEIEWFGESYFQAMTEYKGYTNRLYDTAEYLRRQPELAETDLTRLETISGDFVTFLEEELAPHFENSEDFTATEDIVVSVEGSVRTIRRFSERSDTNRVDGELQSLRVYIDNIRRTEAINERFSDLPIHKPLLDYTTSSNYNSSELFTFIVAHPETNYVAPVRSRERADATLAKVNFGTELERRKYISDLRNIFDGVSIERNRTGRGFLAAHPRTENQPTRLVDIQRYSSAEAAQQARQTLLDGSVTREDTETIGAYDWEQIHYFQLLEVLDPHSGYIVFQEEDGMRFNEDGDVVREDSGDLGNPVEDYSRDLIGDIIYAYLKQTGPYLVTMAPSMTAWEERTQNAQEPIEPLKKAWFWESAQGDSESN